MSLADCRILELPRIADPRGNLTFIEGHRHVPFEIKRVFYLYDVPGGADRAGHALKTCHQFLVAISGSFDVVLRDGENERRVHLNRSYYGLHLPPMVWREIDNFRRPRCASCSPQRPTASRTTTATTRPF